MTDTERLIALAKTGDEDARGRLIEENMGLVCSIARRFAGRGYDYEELCQIGSIGLIKAVDRFDQGFNVKLSTYAVPVIMGEIKKFLRDDGPVKVGRSLKELSAKAMGEKERLEKKLGREATVKELSDSLGVEKEKLVLAMESNVRPKSLYECQDMESGELLIDKIAAQGSCEEEVINKMALSESLSYLDKKEKAVIIMRYFRNMTQSAAALCMGVSQVQVSRIESRAKNKIKKMME